MEVLTGDDEDRRAGVPTRALRSGSAHSLTGEARGVNWSGVSGRGGAQASGRSDRMSQSRDVTWSHGVALRAMLTSGPGSLDADLA